MDLEREVGRINGLTFVAMWLKSEVGDPFFSPMIGLQWHKPTEPDKFAALADQIVDEFLEALEEHERLDPVDDANNLIGKYGLLCSDGDIEMEYVEGARRRQDRKPLQRFLRALSGGLTPGEVLSSRMSADPFYMFASAHNRENNALSMLTVNIEEFERVLQLRAVIDWIRVHHPDIDSNLFRGMIPGVIERSLEFFNETEAQVTS